MKTRVFVPRASFAVLLALPLVVGAAFGADPGAGKPGIVSVPSGVTKTGLTLEQYWQGQIDLSSRLANEVPPSAFTAPLHADQAPGTFDVIDQGHPANGQPLQIGFVQPLRPALSLDGLKTGVVGSRLATPTSDGGYVWAVGVTSYGSGALRAHVTNMNLPRNASLYFYSLSGEAFGPYKGRGPNNDGDFWTGSVFATEGILQIRLDPPVRKADLRAVSLHVGEIGVISPRFTGSQLSVQANWPCGNPSCIEDATCNAGANSIRDAYAKMEWIAGAFIYTCTAGLLNDANPSSTNYVLTANHCISKNNNAKNVNFYWRFRTSTCDGTCPTNNGWPYQSSGSSVAATGRKGDFTLLALTGAPPAGSVRLGFTNAPVANTNGVALHRVSNPNFGPQAYNTQTVSTSRPTCTGWPRGERIYSVDTFGGTDGGSSGSPVVNASDLVVGQLSGGCGTNVNDPCDSASNATVDGALAFYWATVQPFLAP